MKQLLFSLIVSLWVVVAGIVLVWLFETVPTAPFVMTLLFVILVGFVHSVRTDT